MAVPLVPKGHITALSPARSRLKAPVSIEPRVSIVRGTETGAWCQRRAQRDRDLADRGQGPGDEGADMS